MKRSGQVNRIASGLLWAVLLFCHGPAVAEEGRIGSIAVEGNRALSSAEVLRALAISEGDAWSAQAESSSAEKLLLRYAEAGYLEARVTVRSWQEEERIDLLFHLDEGAYLPVLETVVGGANRFTEEEILTRFDTRPNAPLRPAELTEDMDRLVHTYARQGHPFARVLLSRLERAEDPPGIGLSLQVVEGPLLTLGGLSARGSETTRPSTLRRLSGLRIGEPYDQDAVDAARQRLLRTGFFRTVGDPEIEVDWEKKEAFVELEVTEAKTNRIEGVVGYAPAPDGGEGVLSGFIDISFRNILGTARSAEVRWERITPETRHTRVAYREPWIFGTPFALAGEVTQTLRDSTYSRFTGAGEVDVDLSRRVSASFRGGGETMRPRREEGAIPRSSRLWGGVGFLFDGRDFPGNPTGGLLLRLGVEYGERKTEEEPDRGIEGESRRQATLDGRIGLYRSLRRRNVVAWEVEGIARFTDAPFVPLYDQFYVGGARTLRGYDEDQFLGSRLAWSRLEYRYLLGALSRVFLFADTGYIFSRREEGERVVLSERLKTGYGFGLRVDSAIGILGVDYGLGEGDSFADGKVHVSVEGDF